MGKQPLSAFLDLCRPNTAQLTPTALLDGVLTSVTAGLRLLRIHRPNLCFMLEIPLCSGRRQLWEHRLHRPVPHPAHPWCLQLWQPLL